MINISPLYNPYTFGNLGSNIGLYSNPYNNYNSGLYGNNFGNYGMLGSPYMPYGGNSTNNGFSPILSMMPFIMMGITMMFGALAQIKANKNNLNLNNQNQKQIFNSGQNFTPFNSINFGFN